MKLQMKTVLAILLPVVLTGSAAAQVRMALPGGSNPYIGAPAYLPGPIIGPVAGMKIELPAPRLNPGMAISLAPTPAAYVAVMAVIPVLPIPMIPSRPIIPMIRPMATRENVSHPLAPILPGLIAQFGTAEKKNNWQKEISENLFDGRLIPERKIVVDPRNGSAPIHPSHNIGLPEQQLEIEIGAY